MTPGWKLVTLISGTGTPTSKDRELRKPLARWMPAMRVIVRRSPTAAPHTARVRCPCNDQPGLL